MQILAAMLKAHAGKPRNRHTETAPYGKEETRRSHKKMLVNKAPTHQKPKTVLRLRTGAKKEKNMSDKFTAKECNFQGDPGYILSQIRNGETIITQFIQKSAFQDFCRMTGINPEMIDSGEGGSL